MTRLEVEQALWAGNIGLRMPADVIGIDVDAYRGGSDTLAALVLELGNLPLTWISHSGRNDGSGIRFYRVPPAMGWVTGLAGIDIIQPSHRYAAVWPSTHPDGRRYGWWDQMEQAPAAVPPAVEDLPDLPWAWVQHLSRAAVIGSATRAASDAETMRFYAACQRADAPGYLSVIVEHFTKEVAGQHSRHDSMQHCLTWAMEHAAAGVLAPRPALLALGTAWVAVHDDQRRAELHSEHRTTEFAAMTRHAIGKALAKSPAELAAIHDRVAGPVFNVATSVGTQPAAAPVNIRTIDAAQAGVARLLVRGWLPAGELAIIAGKPGVGKGVVIADLMARASRGEVMPNGDRLLDAFISAVICLPGEDDDREWERRLIVAGAVTGRVLLTTMDSNSAGQILARVTALAKMGARLIVVDSLTALTNSAGKDANKGEVRSVLDALSDAARLHDLTVLMIHHVRKQQGDPLDVLSGSTQIAAAARSVLVVVDERAADDTETDIVLLGVAKLNGSKRSSPVGFRTVGRSLLHADGQPKRDDRGDIAYVAAVQWVTDRSFSQGELIAASNGNKPSRSKDRDAAAVDILADGPLPSVDYIAQMGDAGFSTQQAKDARLSVGGALRHHGKWWSYPKTMSKQAALDALAAQGSE
jgi:archaellum biogenesis ATPase FlaH